MKKWFEIFLILSAMTGCASSHRVPPIFTNDEITDIQEFGCVGCGINPVTRFQRYFLENPIEQLNPYKYGTGACPGKQCGSYYERASAGSSTCKENSQILSEPENARNNLMSAAMRLADASTSQHLAVVKATEINANLLLGAATAGLTGGATVAASEEAAKAFSATATGTNASRSMFNETTFRNALGETLVSSIESARELERMKLIGRMKLCIDDYPVELALADVQKYLEAGSFYHGLALIRQAAEQKNLATDKTADAKEEVLFSERPVGDLNESHVASIDLLQDRIDSLTDAAVIHLAANPPVADN